MPGQTGIRNLNGMRGKRKGGLSVKAKSNGSNPRTLTTHVDLFLGHLAARAYSQGSLDAHHWSLKGFLTWADAENLKTPEAFTRTTVEAYQLHLHHYRSPRTGEFLVVNTQLARLGCVRRFFAWLCRRGIIPANPAADLDLPRKQARKLPKALSEVEIQKLLALPDTTDPFGLRDRTILELFYATGIRRTEITRLDLGDYDPAARSLLIRKGKGGKSRLLPVGERAAWWLDRHLAESRPLFSHLPAETGLFLSGYGTRFSPAYLGNWVAGLMKKAEIFKTGSCHLFRHSCATDMLEGGADIRYIQEMLGHARLDTTQIYTHVSIRALTEVHARSHPHGRMSGLGDASDAKNGNLREDCPSAISPDPLSDHPAMCAATSYPVAEPGPAQNPTRSPGDDEPPPESGPPRPPQHPKPPKPGFPPNSLSVSKLLNVEHEAEKNSVTYYGYRYYDPLTGRWLSNDPLEELGNVLLANQFSTVLPALLPEPNLYNFTGNKPVILIDSDGRFSPLILPMIGAAALAYGIYKIWDKANKLSNDLKKANNSLNDSLRDPTTNSGDHIGDACDYYEKAQKDAADLHEELKESAGAGMQGSRPRPGGR